MTLSTLCLGNYGTIVYEGHAGFLVSTVGPTVSLHEGLHVELAKVLNSLRQSHSTGLLLRKLNYAYIFQTPYYLL